MKRGVFRIPTKNKHTLTETLHTTLSIQEWKQSMIQFHNLEKLQECRQLMIQKITFNMTWINDMFTVISMQTTTKEETKALSNIQKMQENEI